MKRIVTRKRRGFFALLLAFVFTLAGFMPMVSNAEETSNRKICFDFEIPTVDGYEWGGFTYTYQGKFTKELLDDAYDKATDAVKTTEEYKKILEPDKLEEWYMVGNGNSDYINSLMESTADTIDLILFPLYEGNRESADFLLAYPDNQGKVSYKDTCILYPYDKTVADVESILNSQVKKPDDFSNDLNFQKWQMPLDSDTPAAYLFKYTDADFLTANAVTDKQYVKLSVEDVDPKPFDGTSSTGMERGDVHYALIADDNNQITLPAQIDGYKYVTFDHAGNDAIHGGLYPYESYGNKVLARVSNIKQPEIEDTNPIFNEFTYSENAAKINLNPAVKENNQETVQPTTTDNNQSAAQSTTENVNTATNPTAEERALAAAKPDQLVAVEASEGKDGGIKAAPAVIQQEVKKVSDAVNKAAGKKAAVKIEMNGANIIPVEVLQEAKGKNVNVTFDMGGYSWTINGKNIEDTGLKDINLAVVQNTNAIPADAVKTIAGTNDTQQISLRHDGTFGFKAALTMKAPANEIGKKGSLYWYDSNHKFVLQNAAVVQKDGTITFEFAHASDYVIVYSSNTASVSPKTGDDSTGNNMFFLTLMLALAAASGILGMRELRKAKREHC